MITTLGEVRTLIREAIDSGMFKKGDQILWGKWKNKKGKIVDVYLDDKGHVTIEIEPFPKGRKKNVTGGLYRVWPADKKNLDERIRQEVGKKFKWNEFLDVQQGLKPIDAAKKATEYASSSLRLLGRGSSRCAYVLTSKTVLKIALIETELATAGCNGLLQNKRERGVAESHPDLPLTKVFKADDRGVWLVAELVNPLRNDEEMKALTGFGELELDEMCDVDFGKRSVFKPKKKLLNKSPFLQLLKRIDAETNIDIGDLVTHMQWGKNASGELRLLDSGL